MAGTGDPRGTRAWRRLRDEVVAAEPVCWLRLPEVCTYWSETADHVQPVVTHPHLAMDRDNLRGICHGCNWERNDTPVEELPGQAAAVELLGFFD